MFHKGVKGKGSLHKLQRVKLRPGFPRFRILVSIVIPALLLIACLWSPLALAESAVATDNAQTQPATPYENQNSATPDDAAAPALVGNQPVSGAVTNPTSPGTMPENREPVAADTNPAGTLTSSATSSDTSSATSSDTSSATVPVDKQNDTPATSSVKSAAASGQTPVNGRMATPADVTSTDDDEVSDGCPDCNLDLICKFGNPGVYWGSHDDYLASLLSIDYKLLNNGPGTATDTHVTSATATNGVTVASPLPDLGTLLPGESIIFTLKWLIPTNVTNFTTSLVICTDCGLKPDDDNHSGDIDNPDDKENPDNNNNLNDNKDQTNNNNPPSSTQDAPPPAVSVNSGTAQITSNPLQATVLPSSLPMTGLESVNAVILGLGLALSFIIIAMPVAGLIRIRRK